MALAVGNRRWEIRCCQRKEGLAYGFTFDRPFRIVIRLRIVARRLLCRGHCQRHQHHEEQSDGREHHVDDGNGGGHVGLRKRTRWQALRHAKGEGEQQTATGNPARAAEIVVATNRETQHGQRYDNGQQQREHHHHHGHQRHGQYAQPAQCDVDKDVKEQAVGKRAALKTAIGREELPEEFFVENFVHVKAVVGGSGKEWCFFTIPNAKGSKSFTAEWLGAFVGILSSYYLIPFKPDGQSILRVLPGGGQ